MSETGKTVIMRGGYGLYYVYTAPFTDGFGTAGFRSNYSTPASARIPVGGQLFRLGRRQAWM